jgi:hypothetical protein
MRKYIADKVIKAISIECTWSNFASFSVPDGARFSTFALLSGISHLNTYLEGYI